MCKVTRERILCIFTKIYVFLIKFYPKLRNFSYFDILESTNLVRATNILKNTFNM